MTFPESDLERPPLKLFLADQGMRTRIVDAAPQAATESRAQVVNPRALELLESTGVAQAMVAQGRAIHRTRFYEDWKLIAELEFAGAHPRYGMTILSQARSEALLAQALRERGVVPERGVQFDALRQEADLVGLLRDNLIPGLTKFGPSAHAMVALLTGLDSDVRLH
ncbi:FAD-dependent oxidoreductase [Paraburkholderia sp. EG287B]|uniref:FAD-dependent oxidoreductase n=1 Tax=unclassified Paraburkholderia TaxID=2615204 RepID=UPI0034D15815